MMCSAASAQCTKGAQPGGESMRLQGRGTALDKNEAAFCDVKRVCARVENMAVVLE